MMDYHTHQNIKVKDSEKWRRKWSYRSTQKSCRGDEIQCFGAKRKQENRNHPLNPCTKHPLARRGNCTARSLIEIKKNNPNANSHAETERRHLLPPPAATLHTHSHTVSVYCTKGQDTNKMIHGSRVLTTTRSRRTPRSGSGAAERRETRAETGEGNAAEGVAWDCDEASGRCSLSCEVQECGEIESTQLALQEILKRREGGVLLAGSDG